MDTSLRRRLDNGLLRWQARLDSERADRWLPWVLAAGLFLLLVALGLAKLRALDGTPDFAAYTQAAFLIREGQAPVLTITTGTNLLAEQGSVIFYLVALLTYVFPPQATLVVLQSGALAVAVVPIWRIARTLVGLRGGATLALVAAYALYPTMHNLNVSGFYPETLALPALLWACFFGLGHHWRRYAACAVFVVLCRSDLGLAVAGLGGLLWLEGRKVEGKASVIGGTLYTLVAVLLVQPRFAAGAFAHLSAFSGFGDSPGSVLWGMVAHPGQVLGAVFREQNFVLLVTLFAPVAFLPLLAPRYLAPALPLQLFFLVADVPSTAVYGRQTVPITAFIFLATAYALGRIGRRGVERITVDRRVLAAMLLASSLFFIRDAASSPYRQPWDWGGRDAGDGAVLAVAEQIGPDRSVRAVDRALLPLAERPTVYRTPDPLPPDGAAAVAGVDALIVSDEARRNWTAVDRRIFDDVLASLGFRRTYAGGGIALYVREP